ncbi:MULTISPECIES: hypothetical protein [Bacillus]|uniref:hypothetical protein n=1 Tax=Bacillus TaxID=1386 RepID=UPI000977AEB1|nr:MULTISPECIES: hypothetical protein [Bacillus]OMP28181.1 hypothetical protein BAE31_03645 [Bacillus sp. I-2]PAK35256.1 hypothetical protein CHI04_08170 [Bacillus safensis]UDB52737.1 hypothetical protein BWL10_07560 [Bacillus safensis]
MKKLLLVPIISLGLFSGITDDVSATETKNYNQNQNISTIMNTSSSIHDKAFELKNGGIGNSYTNKYNPIKYYKFYFDGYEGVSVIFDSKGSHKISILNGNFFEVGTDIAFFPDITSGWNYIEVVDTRPSLGASYFDLKIQWN